jgi:Zn-dependent protease
MRGRFQHLIAPVIQGNTGSLINYLLSIRPLSEHGTVLRDLLAWSFPIGNLFGISMRVHITMPFLMLGLIGRVAFDKDSDGHQYISNTWQDASMLMALMFLSTLLHEFGHCFAARFMDGEADEILMWPLGGLAFCKSLPHNWLAHLVFAAGGPLADLAKCIVLGLILFFGFDYIPPFNPFWYPYRISENSIAIALNSWSGATTTDNIVIIVLARFFWITWVLMLFNLVLLGYPFDSGRMLQAVLWPRLGHYQSTYVAIYCGYGVMLIIGILSIIYREPLLAFLTIFIYVSCAQEMTVLESAHEDSLFGYDFSQGYTSLEKDEPPPPKPKKQNFIQRWLAERAARKEQQEQEQRAADDRRMDELLEKIQKYGKESLTDEEQRFLKRVADRYKNDSRG